MAEAVFFPNHSTGSEGAVSGALYIVVQRKLSSRFDIQVPHLEDFNWSEQATAAASANRLESEVETGERRYTSSSTE
jgi:hypothetical protein